MLAQVLSELLMSSCRSKKSSPNADITRDGLLTPIHNIQSIRQSVAASRKRWRLETKTILPSTNRTMERSTIFNGTIHYFYGHFPVRFLFVYHPETPVPIRYARNGPKNWIDLTDLTHSTTVKPTLCRYDRDFLAVWDLATPLVTCKIILWYHYLSV